MDFPIGSLPPAVIETYLEYKRRQKILVNWLCQQGQACSDQQSKDGLDTKLSISDLERLTIAIASRSIMIPEDILYAARTMLKMRKEVALHYQDADDGHKICISFFEKIVSILSSLPRLPATPSPQEESNHSMKARDAIRNTFAALPPVRLEGLGPDYVPFQSATLSEPEAAEVPIEAEESLTDSDKEGVANEDLHKDEDIEVLGSLYSINSSPKTTMLLLSKARQGLVPLHIAAYVAERALVMNWCHWRAVWLRVCGRKTLTFEFEEAVSKLKEAFQDLEAWSSSTGSSWFPVDLENELLMPYKGLADFSNAPKTRQSAGKAPQAEASSMPRKIVQYKDILPNVRDTDKFSHYYTQLLLDLASAQASRASAAHTRLSLVYPSRVLDLYIWLDVRPCLPVKIFWSNSVHFLLRAAQSFDVGFTNEGTAIPPDDLKPAVNCRLNNLALAQEVLRALDRYKTPEDLNATGFSTRENLLELEKRLQGFLKDNRFDRATQHPVVAGSETLLILDLCYQLGMQLLAFRDTFPGSLHVYNALRSLCLIDEIPVLETLCTKFLEAAFYGTRPCKKFFRAWDFVSAHFNCSETNPREMRLVMNNRHLDMFQFDYNENDSPPFILSERAQYLYEESRLCYNKRLHARKHSFSHRIFNQQEDLWRAVSDEIIEELCGDRAVYFKINSSTKGRNELKDNVIDSIIEEGYTDCTNHMLSNVEEAMLKEFSDPFPLMSANLIRIFHHCYTIVTKAVVKEGRDLMTGPRFCLRDVLRECDEIAVKNSGMAKADLSIQAYRSDRYEEFK